MKNRVLGGGYILTIWSFINDRVGNIRLPFYCFFVFTSKHFYHLLTVHYSEYLDSKKNHDFFLRSTTYINIIHVFLTIFKVSRNIQLQFWRLCSGLRHRAVEAFYKLILLLRPTTSRTDLWAQNKDHRIFNSSCTADNGCAKTTSTIHRARTTLFSRIFTPLILFEMFCKCSQNCTTLAHTF